MWMPALTFSGEKKRGKIKSGGVQTDSTASKISIAGEFSAKL
jgi:hypothetical protein